MLHDLGFFFQLSASLRLQLDAHVVGTENLAALVLRDVRLSRNDRETLLEVIDYVKAAYGDRRRRLGPPAVLHPLRTAALVARTIENPRLIDLMAALLHDKEEDILEEDFDDPQLWRDLEARLQAILKKIHGRWVVVSFRLTWIS